MRESKKRFSGKFCIFIYLDKNKETSPNLLYLRIQVSLPTKFRTKTKETVRHNTQILYDSGFGVRKFFLIHQHRNLGDRERGRLQ